MENGVTNMRTVGHRKPRSLSSEASGVLLAEGYALFVHGYHRATTGIDLLVPATQASGERVKAALISKTS